MLDGVGNEATVYQIMKVCATGLVTEQPHKRVSLADQVYSTIGEKGTCTCTSLRGLM